MGIEGVAATRGQRSAAPEARGGDGVLRAEGSGCSGGWGAQRVGAFRKEGCGSGAVRGVGRV